MPNGDQFNAEIKSLAKQKYIESSNYLSKKGKNAPFENHRVKQNEAARVALKEESFNSGLFDLIFILNILRKFLFSSCCYVERKTSI